MSDKKAESYILSGESASFEEVLVDRLLSPYFGSFWWIHEERVQTAFRDAGVHYDQESDQNAHLHLSILEQNREGRGYVPFLFGSRSSRSNRAVAVRGLTDSEPDSTTYFGAILQPVQLSYAEILQRNEHAEYNPRRRPDEGKKAFDKRRYSSLVGEPWERSILWPNWDKLQASDKEAAALREWCERRGLL